MLLRGGEPGGSFVAGRSFLEGARWWESECGCRHRAPPRKLPRGGSFAIRNHPGAAGEMSMLAGGREKGHCVESGCGSRGGVCRNGVCRNGPIGGARVEGGVDWEVSQGGGAITVGIFGAGGMGEGGGGLGSKLNMW